MSQSAMEKDADFVRRSTKIVALWTSLFFAASLGMIFYGDVLMQLFT